MLLKAYPRSEPQAVLLATNEARAHERLQAALAFVPGPGAVAAAAPAGGAAGGAGPAGGVSRPPAAMPVAELLGEFQTPDAHWLVFRQADGGIVTTAEMYAAVAASATLQGLTVGPVGPRGGGIADILMPMRPLARRSAFVKEAFAQACEALAYVHKRHFLHQSLGPSSLLLSTLDETETDSGLAVSLSELAFAVDASDEALIGGATLAEIFVRGSGWGGCRRVFASCRASLVSLLRPRRLPHARIPLPAPRAVPSLLTPSHA